MKKYKNTELARMYKVSEKTIRNWIDGAEKGTLSLKLLRDRNRFYIADTANNHLLMRDFSQKGAKFKNKSASETISPRPEFYEIFNETQVIDIASNLEIFGEFPHKYTYFNGGADYWDNYVLRTLDEKMSNTVTNTFNLLSLNKEYLFSLVSKYKKVNLVDIGVGNAYPVKDLLTGLLEKNLLGKYIGIDISPNMLDIAKANVKKWYGDSIDFRPYVLDISNSLIRDLLYEENVDYSEGEVVNVVCYLGSSIENMEVHDHSLENIRKSLQINDILIIGRTLDSDSGKMFFDFSEKTETVSDEKTDNRWKWFIDALGLTEESYKYEMLYDEGLKSRIGQILLTKDVNIKFNTPRFKKVLKFNKGERIITWRHRHHTYKQIIEEMVVGGFDVLQTSTSMDRAQILLITSLKRFR
jgi:uncharacterized SAM-dependent methyltransferase